MEVEFDRFGRSTSLRRDLILKVFIALSTGKSIIDALTELNDISCFISFLEGLIFFPIMPDNFKKLAHELNDSSRKEIESLLDKKVTLFKDVLNKYYDGTITVVPLDLIDILWILIDEGNLQELIDLLPDETRQRQIDNFLKIDLNNLSSGIKRKAILNYRESYV